MSPPRHLWSGDWRHESAEAAQRLAERRSPVEEPAEPPEVEPPPRGPSALDRLRAALHKIELPRLRIPARLRGADARRIRGAVLLGAAMLLAGGVAYAAVAALRSPDTQAPSSSQSSSVSSNRAAWLGADTALFPGTTGAIIVDVVPGGPADAAGLQPGDVITEIAGHPVQGPGDIDSALARMHPGQQVQIAYELGPSTYTTQVTLQGRPSGP
ncbi:MAG TPA: PDZ domain-containing protein [Solirubrobacteraceae bacterium]|nr:PDZ domain-containing protein [Solirubrobacteraceae bacterium]